ncbi:MAG: EAL domain-containing protein [Proteobacteria bacterium]|nr:EAL domain-containing protein [Pseudomonadota bacterium]
MSQLPHEVAMVMPWPAHRCGALLLAAALAWLVAVGTASAQPAPGSWQAYQRDFHFQQIDSQNGLVQNSVSLIFQDQRGFMWLVTQGGLFRYDGYSLRRYMHDPNRIDSLPGNHLVTSLADARDGKLWIGSSTGGLILFDPDANKVLPLAAAVQRSGLPVTGLLRIQDDSVLVGTPHGVDRLTATPTPRLDPVWSEPGDDQAGVRSFTRCPDGDIYAAAGKHVLAIDKDARAGTVLATDATTIEALFCGPHGRLLLGDTHGLAEVDRASGAMTTSWQANTPEPVGVLAIAADHAGRIWLGLSNHDLLRLNADGSTTRLTAAPPGIPGALPDSGIETLFVDRTGLLWVGTSMAGAVWTNPEGSAIQAVLALSGDPRAGTYVRALYPATDGGLWVAMNGPGLVRYDPSTRTVTSFADVLAQAVAGTRAATTTPAASSTVPRSITHTEGKEIRIYGILPGADGTLLLPSSRGILRFDPASGKADYLQLDGEPATTPTRALLRARDGDLWVAPSNAGLVRYHEGKAVSRFDKAGGLASDSVLVINQDQSGNIWVGTTDGVSMIHKISGKLSTFREIPGRNDSLAGNTVVSLLTDHAGRVWIGSLSGLSRLEYIDAGGAHFKRYGPADGLPDNTIDCMLEDGNGRVWFSTNLGIGRLDPKTGLIRSYGTHDGLQGLEYNSGACLRTADGRLLFGGHGFDIINPAAVTPASQPAPVVITDVSSGKSQIPVPASPASTVTISADDRSVYLAFASLDYASPGHNRYRYRLSGRDTEWSAPARTRTVAYNNLAPGNYRFQVQSILRDGRPGRTTSLAIHVDTVWWWSLGMRLVYAATLACLLLIALLGWRNHHLEQLRHRRQLSVREGRLRQALWGSGDEFWDWDLERGSILRLGPEGGPGGHHEQSVPAEEWRRTMVHPDDLANLDRALAEHLAGNTEHFEVEHRVRGRNDDWTWVVSRGKVVEHDDAGRPMRVCGTERDISAIRAADRDRRIASEVIRNMSEAVTVTDLDFRFVSVNPAFTRMTGYTEHEVLEHDASILNGSRHAPDSYSHLRQVLAETGHWRGELWQRRKDGEEFLCWVELNEVCDANGQRTHMIGVLTDITDRKRAEQELRYLANYDTLTGLPNRALLGERLGAAVINARRSGHKVGLLFLDLDRFKHVNDSLGHSAGDRTLKAAGARLRQCVRENDVVARLGGDEFTVVLEDLADVRGAEEMAQRLIHAFAKPLPVSGTQETVISPSIGIAMYPDHGQTPADLLKCADTAMYQAKAVGRNTWAVYHPGMDARARDHATLINELRRALDRGELRLVYQPKMAIQTGKITGMEALIRWHNRELGEIPPSVFIPLAEETGQIHEISAYVFATACADLRRFRENGHNHLTMAINLSAAQLNRPDLTSHICDLLAEHDVTPNQVELELTESMVMANAEQSVRLLGELKSIGTRLAIDDFGTGYSSLAYLKRLPIDTLKIDQEFVGDVTTDPDDAAITATIITMAHSLQIKVVAEGVETVEQLAFLRAQRCDEIQGYWLSRPLSAEACLDFLDRHSAASVSVT